MHLKKHDAVSIYTNITTELVNTLTETQLTTLIFLATGLYKITIESVQLLLDVE